LFACDPARTLDPAVCDPADWSLVAPNAVGDPLLSQFDDAGNTAVTLLVATASHLYVGFDNPSGIQLYRSSPTGAAPATRADFEGADGCGADLHPVGCAPFGGSGLGDPVAVRIFDGLALHLPAGDRVFVFAGDGSAAGRLFRIAD